MSTIHITRVNIKARRSSWDESQAGRSGKACVINPIGRDLGFGAIIHRFKPNGLDVGGALLPGWQNWLGSAFTVVNRNRSFGAVAVVAAVAMQACFFNFEPGKAKNLSHPENSPGAVERTFGKKSCIGRHQTARRPAVAGRFNHDHLEREL